VHRSRNRTHLLNETTGVASHLALHDISQPMLEAIRGIAPSTALGWEYDWVELVRLIMNSSVKGFRENERSFPFDLAPPGEGGKRLPTTAGEWTLSEVSVLSATMVRKRMVSPEKMRARGEPLPSAFDVSRILIQSATSSSAPSALGHEDKASATTRRGWILRVGRRDLFGSSVSKWIKRASYSTDAL
jgi:hypothetical protein